jgi:hypothetical protein
VIAVDLEEDDDDPLVLDAIAGPPMDADGDDAPTEASSVHSDADDWGHEDQGDESAPQDLQLCQVVPHSRSEAEWESLQQHMLRCWDFIPLRRKDVRFDTIPELVALNIIPAGPPHDRKEEETYAEHQRQWAAQRTSALSASHIAEYGQGRNILRYLDTVVGTHGHTRDFTTPIVSTPSLNVGGL